MDRATNFKKLKERKDALVLAKTRLDANISSLSAQAVKLQHEIEDVNKAVSEFRASEGERGTLGISLFSRMFLEAARDILTKEEFDKIRDVAGSRVDSHVAAAAKVVLGERETMILSLLEPGVFCTSLSLWDAVLSRTRYTRDEFDAAMDELRLRKMVHRNGEQWIRIA